MIILLYIITNNINKCNEVETKLEGIA